MQQHFLPIYNTQGKEIDKVNLEPDVFDGDINNAVLYQVVLMYRANQRKGLASTKTRGEVSGGGRKPWRQKGTGRARVGSIRSPLWKGGGVVFGPHQRDYSYSLPGKLKISGLKSSLNAKLKEKSILVLDKIEIQQPKTKEFLNILSNLEPLMPVEKKENSLLFLIDKVDNALKKAVGNLKFLCMGLAKSTNAYEILRSRQLIITKEAFKQLEQRIKNQLGQGSRKKRTAKNAKK